MSSDDADSSRRRFLTAATVVAGAVGTVAVAVPFVASWSPSARAKSAGAPVEANISKLQPGQQIIVKWRGKPVWVVRRDEKALRHYPRLPTSCAIRDRMKACNRNMRRTSIVRANPNFWWSREFVLIWAARRPMNVKLLPIFRAVSFVPAMVPSLILPAGCTPVYRHRPT